MKCEQCEKRRKADMITEFIGVLFYDGYLEFILEGKHNKYKELFDDEEDIRTLNRLSHDMQKGIEILQWTERWIHE